MDLRNVFAGQETSSLMDKVVVGMSCRALDMPDRLLPLSIPSFAFDDPVLLKRFPHGFSDGVSLFVPASVLKSDSAEERLVELLEGVSAPFQGKPSPFGLTFVDRDEIFDFAKSKTSFCPERLFTIGVQDSYTESHMSDIESISTKGASKESRDCTPLGNLPRIVISSWEKMSAVLESFPDDMKMVSGMMTVITPLYQDGMPVAMSVRLTASLLNDVMRDVKMIPERFNITLFKEEVLSAISCSSFKSKLNEKDMSLFVDALTSNLLRTPVSKRTCSC